MSSRLIFNQRFRINHKNWRLLKQLLVTETTTYSPEDVPPPPLEDDNTISTEALSVEDPKDQKQTLEYQEYHPHWESLPFGCKT